MTEQQRQLIHGYLDGRLSSGEFDRLERLLHENAEARRLLRDLSTIDAKLSDYAASEPSAIARPVVPHSGLWGAMASAINISSLRSIATGMVIGVFCTSMVHAVILPDMKSGSDASDVVWEMGFEGTHVNWHPGFPVQAGQWGGNPARVVGAEFGITPLVGDRMLRMDPQALPGAGEDERLPFPRMNYIIDLDEYPELRGGDNRNIQVSASYHRKDADAKDRFILRAATYDKDLQDIDPRWMKDLWGESRDHHSVDQAARGFSRGAKGSGWQTVTLTISAPPGSRHLVLGWFAGTTSGAPQTPIYLDDFRISLLPSESREVAVR